MAWDQGFKKEQLYIDKISINGVYNNCSSDMVPEKQSTKITWTNAHEEFIAECFRSLMTYMKWMYPFNSLGAN